MNRRARIWFGLCVGVALIISLVSLALDWGFKTETGLTRSFYRSLDFEGEPAAREVAGGITLAFLDDQPDVPRRFSVEWDGTWFLRRAGKFDISVDVDDAVEVRVDDAVVLRKDLASREHMISRQIELSKGSHALNVRYQQHRGGYFLAVLTAPAGDEPAEFSRESLFPRVPSDRNVTANHSLEVFRRAVLAVWLAILAALVGFLVPPLVRGARWLLDQIPFPEAEA